MRREAAKVIGDLSVRFRPALMAFFLRRIRNFSEAEDLTQEVLLRVAQKSETLDTGRPDAYVFQIAANLLRDRARRTNVRDAYLSGAAIIEEARAAGRGRSGRAIRKTRFPATP